MDYDSLEKINKLRKEGILTKKEFEAEKKKLLGNNHTNNIKTSKNTKMIKSIKNSKINILFNNIFEKTKRLFTRDNIKFFLILLVIIGLFARKVITSEPDEKVIRDIKLSRNTNTTIKSTDSSKLINNVTGINENITSEQRYLVNELQKMYLDNDVDAVVQVIGNGLFITVFIEIVDGFVDDMDKYLGDEKNTIIRLSSYIDSTNFEIGDTDIQYITLTYFYKESNRWIDDECYLDKKTNMVNCNRSYKNQ